MKQGGRSSRLNDKGAPPAGQIPLDDRGRVVCARRVPDSAEGGAHMARADDEVVCEDVWVERRVEGSLGEDEKHQRWLKRL